MKLNAVSTSRYNQITAVGSWDNVSVIDDDEPKWHNEGRIWGTVM